MPRSLSDAELLTAPAHEIQDLLTSGQTTSEIIVGDFLDQIERHNLEGHKLRAILFTAPRELALGRARQLDEERAAGHVRGPLHGIPIIIKDAYATHPDLGMPTTAGCFALLGSKPRKNAVVIDRLIDAGMVVLGKTSMTEFSNYKDTSVYPGWTPIGGQTQSGYVVEGTKKGDWKLSVRSPGGSSTGVAVGISAGFSPLGIGTETDGSLNTPASRAALFALKVSIGSSSSEGVISISSTFDSLVGMGKTVKDVALLTDVLLNEDAQAGFPGGLVKFLTDSWKGIRVGVVGASLWQLPPQLLVPDEEYKVQMKSALDGAAEKMKD